MPEKEKDYYRVIFTPEVIRGAVSTLITALPQKHRKPEHCRFSIETPHEKWTYDNEEEFFSDYLKAFDSAVFIKGFDVGEISLWSRGQLFVKPYTKVIIKMPTRADIEKVFNTLEPHVEKCRLPEPPPKEKDIQKAKVCTTSTIVPFVAMSFDESDDNLNQYITNILRALGVDFETGERYSKDSIPEKVRKRIIGAGLFIVIFVKRDKIEGDGYITHPWLIKELGIALGSQKDVIAWVERGINDIAGLDYEKEVIYFERGSVEEMGKATIKFLEALKEHKVV